MKLLIIRSFLAITLLTTLSQTALAGNISTPNVPELDVLAMLAIGGVVLAAIKLHKRRK